MRGQAFVTFDDLPSATTALRKMSGTQFMGRQMTVTYAKQLSDKVGSIQGDGGSRRARARKRKADRDEDVAKRVKVGEEGDVAKPGWTTPAPVS